MVCSLEDEVLLLMKGDGDCGSSGVRGGDVIDNLGLLRFRSFSCCRGGEGGGEGGGSA